MKMLSLAVHIATGVALLAFSAAAQTTRHRSKVIGWCAISAFTPAK